MTDRDENADAERGSDVHNMGGAIGPASIRGSGEPSEGRRTDDEAAPRAGFAQPVQPVAGPDSEHPEITGTPDADVVAPMGEPVASGVGTPYVGLPDPAETDPSGTGADGDTAARLEQKRQGGP